MAESIRENFEVELEKVYEKYHCIKDSEDVLLHDNCCFRDKCWTAVTINTRGHDRNRITFPYIGNKYNHDLMCIGLNMHESGGKNRLIELIDGVNAVQIGTKRSLAMGNTLYRETPLWHRTAVYAHILLNNAVSTDGEVLGEIYNRIVFLDAIKCSPRGHRSKPTKTMKKHCPGKILYEEIKILLPKNILALGVGVSKILKEIFPSTMIKTSDVGNMEYYEITTDTGKINVYSIISPTARRGGNRIIFYDKLLDFKKSVRP